MPIYDRPVRSLVHDMVGELAPAPATEFTREEALAWFRKHYPKINGNTASAHLIMITTNLPSRLHYGPRQGGEDDLLLQVGRGRYRRYDPAGDPPPIRFEEPSEPIGLRERLLPLVESVYPAWSGFDDPRFVGEEIVHKQKAVDAATEMLGREDFGGSLQRGDYDEIIHRLKSVAKRGGNLLWMNMPDSGDLRILSAPELDRSAFCRALFDLLHGEGESSERLARYLAYVDAAGLPTNWSFPTYFLFVCHPESELLVKPGWMKSFLALIDRRAIMTDAPRAETYESLLRLAGELRAAFDEFDPGDMVDIQSLMWVCATREAPGPQGGLAPEPKRIEVRAAAEARARAIVERRLGVFDEAGLREFLREVNTDWQNGRMHYNRFGTAFGGSLVAMLVEKIAALNIWTERIWNADDTAIDALLDEFWTSMPVKGAGRGYVTMLLYLKDPERYAIWLPALDHGLAALADYPPMQARTAAEYRRFRTAVQAFRADHGLAPQAVDYVLSQASARPDTEVPPIIGDEDPVESPIPPIHLNPIHSIEEIAERTGFAAERLERWVRAINRKKQAIIYGPPGTGKTYIAKHLAGHLIGGGDGIVETVQFHPAYSYEDFMQGIRPQLTANGGLDYRMMRGRFLSFCDAAAGREGICVMIVDEINRANLARVLGELMYLLEYRDEEIPLAGGGRFRIPGNVRIIGTMNTADRSIALVDHALRRRFAFLELCPELDVLLRYHERENTGFPAERLAAELGRLNNAINDPHYAIGISYFLRPDLADTIEDIWRMEIEPYLMEYFYDQPVKARDFAWGTIGKQFGA